MGTHTVEQVVDTAGLEYVLTGHATSSVCETTPTSACTGRVPVPSAKRIAATVISRLNMQAHTEPQELYCRPLHFFLRRGIPRGELAEVEYAPLVAEAVHAQPAIAPHVVSGRAEDLNLTLHGLPLEP
jgi:hypothetical protein